MSALVTALVLIGGILTGQYYIVGFLLIMPPLTLGIWKRFNFKEHLPKESKWPIQLSSHACGTFEIFPGQPEGYSAYTDYFAMDADVNDDLAARPPAEQYALLGFGSGFLGGLKRRLEDEYQTQPRTVHVHNASLQEQQFLGWLTCLQRSGVDTADPSTENLRGTIECISAEVLVNGPISGTFLEKMNSSSESKLHTIKIDLEKLEELKEEYQKASALGEKHALEAGIVARDTVPT